MNYYKYYLLFSDAEDHFSVWKFSPGLASWAALGLTDDGFLVVAGHVMESDSISVKVIQDGETELIALSIVRLTQS